MLASQRAAADRAFQLETLDQESLASRMTLNSLPASITAPVLTESHRVTIIEVRTGVSRFGAGRRLTLLAQTLDEVAISAALRDHLRGVYPQARTAMIKQGGNFPHLANSDEINMHIKVRTRRLACDSCCLTAR